MARRRKVRSALDLIIRGSIGRFSVSHGGTSSVDVRYLQTHINVSQWGDHNERLLKNLAPVREVFDVRDLDFEQIMQRDIDDGRVSMELIPYILGEAKSGLVKLFPPIIVVVLPRDGKQPADHYPTVERGTIKEDDEVYESIRAGDVGREVFEMRRWIDRDEPQDHDYAELRINTTSSALVIVDGQHRAMALLALYRNLHQWPEGTRAWQPFYERWTADQIKQFDLTNVQLPVMLCVFPDLDGQPNSPNVKVHEACRSVFLALNKNAKKVTRARNFLLDDHDLVSVFMRSVLSRIKGLPIDSPRSIRIWNIELDTDRDKNMLYSPVAVSGVTHLYHLIERLVMAYPCPDKTMRISGVKLGKRTGLDWAISVLRVHDELPSDRRGLRRHSWDAETMKVLLPAFERRFGRLIVRFLSEFGPYDANNRASKEHYIGLRESSADVAGAVHAILFDGQGLDRVFEGYRKDLAEERKAQLSRGDGHIDPHLEAVIKSFDGRAEAYAKRVTAIGGDRLDRILANVSEAYRTAPAIREEVGRIYKHTFTSAAFQHALVLTFFTFVYRVDEARKKRGEQLLDEGEIDTRYEEYLAAVNKFFVPQSDEGLENLLEVMTGEVQTGGDDDVQIVQSNNALRHILIPGHLDPKEWPKFRVMLVELWRSGDDDFEKALAKTRDNLRSSVYSAFVERRVKSYAHENAEPIAAVMQDDEEGGAYSNIRKKCAVALANGLARLGADVEADDLLNKPEPIPEDPDVEDAEIEDIDDEID